MLLNCSKNKVNKFRANQKQKINNNNFHHSIILKQTMVKSTTFRNKYKMTGLIVFLLK